jgi:hypothetical protein
MMVLRKEDVTFLKKSNQKTLMPLGSWPQKRPWPDVESKQGLLFLQKKKALLGLNIGPSRPNHSPTGP